MHDPQQLARGILDAIPPTMHRIRLEMRTGATDELSVPQFRVLACIYRELRQASEIARHLGVSAPAVSKMLDLLVERGLVLKSSETRDRRQTALALTPDGERLLKRARALAQKSLEEKLLELTPGERLELARGI